MDGRAFEEFATKLSYSEAVQYQSVVLSEVIESFDFENYRIAVLRGEMDRHIAAVRLDVVVSRRRLLR